MLASSKWLKPTHVWKFVVFLAGCHSKYFLKELEGKTATASARNPQMSETYALFLAFTIQLVMSRFRICLLQPLELQKIGISLRNKKNSWATRNQDVNIQRKMWCSNHFERCTLWKGCQRPESNIQPKWRNCGGGEWLIFFQGCNQQIRNLRITGCTSIGETNQWNRLDTLC